MAETVDPHCRYTRTKAMNETSSFAHIVRDELVGPLLELCELLSEEGAHEEFAFFSGLLTMLQDPGDQVRVLEAVIELSRCAFLGFNYSPEATTKIDAILERAILLSHTMSAPDNAGRSH